MYRRLAVLALIGSGVIAAVWLAMAATGSGSGATAIALDAPRTATPTSAPTRTATPEPTATPTPEPTATPTSAPTRTATPEPTATPTPEPTAALLAATDIGYIPVLMYHYVRTVDPVEDNLGYRLSVTPEVFEQQLQWLQERGYKTITMERLAACMRGERYCPRNAVVLTFDDGYEDAATAALPLLLEYGFTGTFYIVPGFVGKPNYMTWDQIRELHASGMEIGSHSINHPDLAALDPAAARAEIEQSRAIIEAELGVPVRSFSYPAGKYSPAVIEMTQAAGYTHAVTTWQGRNMQRTFEIPRRRVLGGDPVAAMAWYLTPPDFD